MKRLHFIVHTSRLKTQGSKVWSALFSNRGESKDWFLCIKKNRPHFAQISRLSVFLRVLHTYYWSMMVFGKHRHTSRKWRKKTGKMEWIFLRGMLSQQHKQAFLTEISKSPEIRNTVTTDRKCHPALMIKDREWAWYLRCDPQCSLTPVWDGSLLMLYSEKIFTHRAWGRGRNPASWILKLAELWEKTGCTKKEKVLESKVLGPSAASPLSSSLDWTHFFELHPLNKIRVPAFALLKASHCFILWLTHSHSFHQTWRIIMGRVGSGREEGQNDAMNKGAYTVTCVTVDQNHRKGRSWEGQDDSQPGRAEGRFTLEVTICRTEAN